MKAAVYHSPGDLWVEDWPDPRPEPNNLVLRVLACSICTMDVKLATVGHPRCHPPRVVGHEMVGRIEHVGDRVEGFAVGERVTLATTLACGQCPYCALGLGNVCPNARPICCDFDGAFAQRVAIPELALAGGNVIKVPDHVPDTAAVLSEPFSCAVNALEAAGFQPGWRVLIIGGGPMGALHALLAQALGAQTVMVVQRSEPRLSLLRRLRGVRVIDGARENVLQVVKEATDGLGVDLVSVCAPTREAHERALRYPRKGGAVSLFASLPKGGADITLDSRAIHYGQLRITGASDSRPEHVQKAIDLMASGRLETGPVITHRLRLDELHVGIDLMRNKKCLKVLLDPGETGAAGPG